MGSEQNLVEGEFAIDDPPTRDEIELLFGAVLTAVAPSGDLTELQAMVFRSLVDAMVGVQLDPEHGRIVLPADLVPVVEGGAGRPSLLKTASAPPNSLRATTQCSSMLQV